MVNKYKGRFISPRQAYSKGSTGLVPVTFWLHTDRRAKIDRLRQKLADELQRTVSRSMIINDALDQYELLNEFEKDQQDEFQQARSKNTSTKIP